MKWILKKRAWCITVGVLQLQLIERHFFCILVQSSTSLHWRMNSRDTNQTFTLSILKTQFCLTNCFRPFTGPTFITSFFYHRIYFELCFSCRDVDGTQEQIDHAMISMRDVGFINYFGMQRFGNSQVATHLVGRAILHSNWEETVDLILKPREGSKLIGDLKTNKSTHLFTEQVGRHGDLCFIQVHLLHEQNGWQILQCQNVDICAASDKWGLFGKNSADV